ncbi:MAG: polyhydroxyalkanoate depolymerase [Caulobacterales bacterium]|nr:polyhydroxyalkanoate depolymerase [Caulobacterales bacterium]MCA0372520.1 polyhydroxyalkanoate depolymerase [Pseudomonadota bacterium]
MLYSLVEFQRAALAPMRALNSFQSYWLKNPMNPFVDTKMVKQLSAASDVFEAITRNYGKPEWGLDTTFVNGVEVDVTPEIVWESPWARLLHFRRTMDGKPVKKAKRGNDPRVLIVAPLSGHYATLLRGTVEAFLPDNEVYISDWSDAKEVPIAAGRFDLDDYIDHIRNMLNNIGGGAHIVAVCQPGPPVLATIALMSEDEDKNLPATMCFVGSPIDARKSPTIANKLADERPFTWFKSNMIHTVPLPNLGAFRRVYPGFVQLYSFMSLNKDRHIEAHKDYFNHLVDGDGDGASKHRKFYDEYLSVLDLTEEFYLQTIEKVFQEHHLPRGCFYHRDRLVKPEKITKVALMTVEGELDDISGIGQTQAAHDLCVNIPKDMKLDHIQKGVGHYGVFNGRKFREEIYPKQMEFILKYDKQKK